MLLTDSPAASNNKGSIALAGQRREACREVRVIQEEEAAFEHLFRKVIFEPLAC